MTADEIWIGNSQAGLLIEPKGLFEDVYHHVSLSFFAGEFRGGVATYFLGSFDPVCREIDALHHALSGSATFPTCGEDISIQLSSTDELGHIEALVSASLANAKLTYGIGLDQSHLPELSRALRDAFSIKPVK